MAKKVTQEDIENINEIYLKVGTYAATAREIGFSAGTVKKYIIPNYISKENLKQTDYTPFKIEKVASIQLFLTNEEKEEIKTLWEEIAI